MRRSRSMIPPKTLGAELATARRSGIDFNAAWSAALTTALRGCDERAEWAVALDATRAAWSAAYHAEPARRAERALALVGSDPERTVAIGAEVRLCGVCGDPLEASRRSDARYCSRVCQRAAHGRRVAA